jgi:hypothetical protein
MGKFELAKYLSRLRDPEYLAKHFLFSASLILAGIKPGVLVSLKNSCVEAWANEKAMLCEETGISAIELYRSETTFSVLLYDAAMLSDTLNDARARRLLGEYGYPTGYGAAAQLAYLKRRCCMQCGAARREQEFPHEIGIFLGYPPADVSAFIATGGEACLCCRYWKVYHDVPLANEVFRKMDAVRLRAAELVGSTCSVRKTAELISQVQLS